MLFLKATLTADCLFLCIICICNSGTEINNHPVYCVLYRSLHPYIAVQNVFKASI